MDLTLPLADGLADRALANGKSSAPAALTPGLSLAAGPLLVLETGSPTILVGLWDKGRWRAVHEATPPAEALDALFAATTAVLAASDCAWADVAGVVVSEGPGSVLGLRLAMVAVRTWQALRLAEKRAPWPIWQWNRLHLAARGLGERAADCSVTVLADFRQRQYLAIAVAADGSCGPVEVLDPAAAQQLAPPVYLLPARKAWLQPPAHFVTWSPDLPAHPEWLALPGVCWPVAEPKVFALGEAATYLTWDGRRHRAPVAPS